MDAGLAECATQWILSPLRLPFRHPGLQFFLEPRATNSALQPVLPLTRASVILRVVNMHQPKRAPVLCVCHTPGAMIFQSLHQIAARTLVQILAVSGQQHVCRRQPARGRYRLL
jgi:hypothetical protein